MKPIYTFDTETDPFSYGRIPQVFTCGIYTGADFKSFWGENCMQQMREYIATLPSGIIYVHNGGRFDFYYMLDWFDGKMSIINSRIIRAYGLGHEWRDSSAIYPMPLKSYKKDDISYDKLEADVRDKHRKIITEYMQGDCVYLHELVSKFLEQFGDNLTIGSTSMKQLKKIHKFKTLSAEDDARIRSKFYFGGRVQCFEKGILTPKEDNFYVYDINQSYPASMSNFSHPIGQPIFGNSNVSNNTFFLSLYGYSFGCFPKRDDSGGLYFPIGMDTFHVTIHEYQAALDTNQFVPHHIIEVIDFTETGDFAEFVSAYHGLRKQARLNGDELGSNFYKLVCNSAYGKFAQCPDNYKDYIIKPIGVPVHGYDEEYIIGEVCLWSKPSDDVTRYNVATGASITGASRSFLIRALASAKRPLYCDTDSIICEGMGSDIECDEYKLGAWKLEKHGNKFALAGRKLYALFNQGECVKMACKGVRLTAEQIESVAGGETITWKKDAPTFSLASGTKFIHRDVRLT
jgi:hypothetical protein